MTAEKLRRHRFAFPPESEQSAIASHLDGILADLDRASERANREIDLLREYRTRLIADVVTGKLDVRGVALPALDEGDGMIVGEDAGMWDEGEAVENGEDGVGADGEDEA